MRADSYIISSKVKEKFFCVRRLNMGYKTKEWRNSMRVTVDYNNMMSKFLGEQGIRDAQLREVKGQAEAAYRYVAENRGKDELYMGWTEQPSFSAIFFTITCSMPPFLAKSKAALTTISFVIFCFGIFCFLSAFII